LHAGRVQPRTGADMDGFENKVAIVTDRDYLVGGDYTTV
jgi:hypothetical protein